MNTNLASSLLELVALAIPPVAVLIRMLRHSDNIEWRTRKWSFALAAGSVVFFLLAAGTLAIHLVLTYSLPTTLEIALTLTVLGLVPFAAFMGVLYREQRLEFGP